MNQLRKTAVVIVALVSISAAQADSIVIVGDYVIDADISLGTGDLFLDVTGNVTQQAGDTINANGLALMVDGATTLSEANDVNIIAADAGGQVLYRDADSLTVGSVTVDGMSVTGITTSNDDVKLTVGADLNIDDDISLGTGDLLLDVTGNVTQQAGDTINANGLALMVDGATTLSEANDVNIFAADAGGQVLYRDADGLTVGSVTVDGMSVTGITTSNDDVKLTVGADLNIDDDISLGTGDLLLDVTGNVTQQAGDTINANGLALMVDGATTLSEANDVNIIAADTGGQVLYRDADSLTVGSVTVDGMSVTGITTSNDDVKLTVGADLNIDDDISLGTGDLLLDVTGNVTQQAGDTINANGLALMVDGATTLSEANDVNIIAADAGGQVLYRDADGLTVGSVTVDGMSVTGITTSNDDVKLTVGADLNIDDDISLGTGDLLLDVTGNVTQQAGDTINANALALMVDGATTLSEANDVNIIAADAGGQVLYRDADSLTVGSVTVDGMSVTGITTSNDDVKLTVGADLNIDDDISLGTGDLLLDVTGNVTQQAGDTINANGLALMVDGATTLSEANDVNIIAADTGGQVLYRDADSLTVGSVTVDGMSVTGITTSTGEVDLQVGTDLAVRAGVAAPAISLVGGGSGILTVDDSIFATDSLSISGFDTLALTLTDDLMTSDALMQIAVNNILFDATDIALFDGLIFQILNAIAFDFTTDPGFLTAGLADNFLLDTGMFVSDGFVMARLRDATSVPEPGTLALLVIGLAGMGLSRRRKKM